MTSSVQKRARVEGCEACQVLCGGAPELAGFTRAVTKHLLSLPCLALAFLKLACLSSVTAYSSTIPPPSAPSSSSSSTSLLLPPPGVLFVLVSRRFHMEARLHCSKHLLYLRLLIAPYCESLAEKCRGDISLPINREFPTNFWRRNSKDVDARCCVLGSDHKLREALESILE